MGKTSENYTANDKSWRDASTIDFLLANSNESAGEAPVSDIQLNRLVKEILEVFLPTKPTGPHIKPNYTLRLHDIMDAVPSPLVQGTLLASRSA